MKLWLKSVIFQKSFWKSLEADKSKLDYKVSSECILYLMCMYLYLICIWTLEILAGYLSNNIVPTEQSWWQNWIFLKIKFFGKSNYPLQQKISESNFPQEHALLADYNFPQKLFFCKFSFPLEHFCELNFSTRTCFGGWFKFPSRTSFFSKN